MLRDHSLPALAFLALLAGSACAATGCVTPTQEIIALPGYPEFTVSVSPGVAPGLTDGCDGDEPVVGRLLGRVYDIPLETRSLPDFAAMSPVETVCLDRLHVTPRRSVYPGFPGLSDRFRWFAVDLQGAFDVREAGLFYFRLTSDDGSRFFVDDTLVVDNDGYHPPRMALGAARITAGRHSIRVEYWQGPGPLALVLEVARPGEAYHVFHIEEGL
jgi:hypothetical protein